MIEIHSVKEILPYLDENTDLFLDLDNTILTSVSDFGGDAWERFLINHFVESGMEENVAVERASLFWRAVQTVSEIELVEEEIGPLIKGLKTPCFVITARSLTFRNVTEEQINSLNLKFSDCKVPFSLGEPDFVRGVFYCGDTPKWKVLKWYADRHPGRRLVFVDDLRDHVERAAENLEAIVALRYGYLDKRKENYVPCEATKLLGKVIAHPHASNHLKMVVLPKDGP